MHADCLLGIKVPGLKMAESVSMFYGLTKGLLFWCVIYPEMSFFHFLFCARKKRFIEMGIVKSSSIWTEDKGIYHVVALAYGECLSTALAHWLRLVNLKEGEGLSERWVFGIRIDNTVQNMVKVNVLQSK
jgi:hypothetical protein